MELSLLLVLAARHALPAIQARGGADETIVSARKRDEKLVDVPLSATVIGGAELEQAGALSVRDAAARLPNTVFSEFSSRRLSFPFVRGVGSGINDPAVITYVDDVPQFGFGGTNLPLVAVERIEFLRGPQGTLYGRSALGGLIHVHGRRPTAERFLDLGVGYGDYDLRDYSGSYSGSLGGDFLGDFAVLNSAREGYTENDFTGNRVDDRDAFFGRGRVLWNPSEESELDFSLFGERARDGGFVLSELDGLRANPHHINQDFEGLANRDVLNPALVYRLLGDELDFTSVTSFERWDVFETSDFDFSPIDGVQRRTKEDQRYLYQELRLGTAAEDHKRGEFSWLAGASGSTSQANRSAENIFRPGGAGIFFPPSSVGADFNDGQFDDDELALFGQLSVPLGASFAVEGGLRYDRRTSEVQRLHTFDPGTGPIVLGQDEASETFDELLPKASISWFAEAETLVYVSATKGFKAGGFNLTAPAGSEQFDAETAWNYELGLRQSFDDERYTLGLTAFRIDWEDMQLSQFDATAGGYVANVGQSTSEGLELEGRADMGEGLDGYGSFGLLNTEIDEFTDSFGTDTSGNDLPFAPDSTWSLGLAYAGELPSGARWTFGGDYTRTGDFFYDAGNRAGDSFGLTNFRLAADSKSYGVSVWVHNAFDEEYETVAFQPSPVDPNTFVGESGAPRVLGFTLSIHL